MLFFSKSERTSLFTERIKIRLTPEELAIKYDRKDEKGAFTDGPILRSPSMGERPNLVYEYKGYIPDTSGWRVSLEKLIEIDEKGDLGWSSTGKPYRKLRPANDTGNPIGNCWTDISLINPQAIERLGYPTQKPEFLLERIITASSNERDVILDPFCGCGTTIAMAQKLNRGWIGIDITHLAIALIRHRLRDTFGEKIRFEVVGEPVDLPGARTLAEQDRFQFQWWALGLVGARPVEQKKGSDKGIDGRIYFHDEGAGGHTKQIILSVKSGHVSVRDLRDLRGVVDREQAAIGVLITLEEPSRPMATEAASAGFYVSPGWRTRHPKLQILTIGELLAGKQIDQPQSRQVDRTFKKAPKAKEKGSEQKGLL